MTESMRRVPLSMWSVSMRPVRAAGFWAAVTLPPMYLAVFSIAPDMDNVGVLFAGAVSLNIIAAVVGHGYGRD